MLASKLPEVETSIFAKMTALAVKFDAINLAQGFPNFLPPQALMEYLPEATRNGFNQYAPMPGLMALRQQIKRRISNSYQFDADEEDEITVFAGATQAIYTTISALVGPGDRVIIFEPAYDSYAPAVRIHGGIPVYLRLKAPTFEVPWDEFEHTLKIQEIKMILINNPHNPSGKIWSAADMEKLICITGKSKCILLFDEVYDLLVFDNLRHNSALTHQELMQKSVVVFSFGKTLHNTGWKVGYAVAPAYLTKEIRKVHQFTVFSVNSPAQYAIATFMEKHPDFFTDLGTFYQQKRDFFLQHTRHSKLRWLNCEGSYFILATYSDVADLPDTEMAEILVSNNRLACVPISAFYHDRFDPKILRFCFAKTEETLLAAAEILNAL